MELAKLLKPEAVKVVNAASSKKRLLQDIADVVESAYGFPAALVVDALMAREALGPTGVGHGVALPHARLDGWFFYQDCIKGRRIRVCPQLAADG